MRYLAVIFVVLGCRAEVHIPDGVFACSTTPDCPPDFVCVASLCYSSTDAGEGCETASECPAVPGGVVECVAGRCGFRCAAGRDDCNMDGADGCEADLTSRTTCGSCAEACPPDHTCGEGGCELACPEGFDDCNSNPMDGCEAPLGTPDNCQMCGDACAGGGVCDRVESRCLPDCGAALRCGDVCVDPMIDAMHCGGCGMPCRGPCVGGICDPVDTVANGFFGGCVIRRSGRLQCAGTNYYGDLATPNPSRPYSLPTDVINPADLSSPFLARAVAPSYLSIAMIDSEGRLWGSGFNAYGQVGGSGGFLLAPRLVPSDDEDFMGRDFVQVSGVWFHHCAVDSLGDVWCFGLNSSGQADPFGPIIAEQRSARRIELGLDPAGEPRRAVKVAASVSASCAAMTTGEVVCWGRDISGVFGDGARENPERFAVALVEGVTDIESGSDSFCAQNDEGVFCWGGGSDGRFGVGSIVAETPVRVTEDGEVVQTFAHGFNHTCIVSDLGVRCAGGNGRGALGTGDTVSSTVFRDVVGAPADIESIDALLSTCVTYAGGQVQCWGDDRYGALSTGNPIRQSEPVSVAPVVGTPYEFREFVMGANHGCGVLAADSTVRCFGEARSNGQLAVVTVPELVPSLTNTQVLGLGDGFSCSAEGADEVRCWGVSADRRLGRTSDDTSIPASIATTPGTGDITQLALGTRHACMVRGGRVYCWGDNSGNATGQDGGTTRDPGGPVMIAADTPLEDVSAIDAGQAFSCAVTGGRARCWGAGASGCLGNGSFSNQTFATEVSGLSNVASIATGDAHACAVLDSGVVRCWGVNDRGQLGIAPATTQSATPVAVAGISNAVGIAATFRSTCALLETGRVTCWGDNRFSALAQPDAVLATHVPTVVAGILDAVGIHGDALGETFCSTHGAPGALTAQCWGSAVFGALPNGVPRIYTEPVSMVLAP